MNNRKRSLASIGAKLAFATCCAAGIAGVGGAIAYLTDTDSVENRFTVVPALDIAVIEEEWDRHPDEDGDGVPDPAEELVPLQTVAKDPAIENTDGTTAWVFAEVSVPTYEVLLVGGDGRLAETSALTELFAYVVNEGWVEAGEAVFDEQRNVTVHRYAWNGTLEPGARTNTIFDEVQLVNLVDNQLDFLAENGAVTLHIGIEGIGIQTETFDTWEDAWAAYEGQER